ncbi:MAG: hypothetical protein GX207_11890 [Peptococcaceae bacterium]|nr:hypothetical protein [Peptococcaceae bacterium]
MKYKIILIAICINIFLILFPSSVYANSSWHWVTVSPMVILPFAVIFTLFIETASVVKFGKVANSKKVFLIVSLANLLSFIAPYLIRAYRFIPTSGGFSIMAAFNKGPYYMILSGYLILTIIVELPVVYRMLKKETSSKKSLITAILLSNIVTTLLVAVLERVICVGRW